MAVASCTTRRQVLILGIVLSFSEARRHRTLLPRVPAAAGAAASSSRGSTANCTERWAEVQADHFSWRPMPLNSETNAPHAATFPLRYFTCGEENWGGPGSPVWFYTGNEANVEQYVNATGLMWENAAAHSAMMVFAEHRFYGSTRPCHENSDGGGDDDDDAQDSDCLHLLTHEQAGADYVELVAQLKAGTAAGLPGCSGGGYASCDGSAVIAFGGSYGGMLSAWVRMKYPATFHGAIAASAPIMGFPGIAAPPSLGGQAFYGPIGDGGQASGQASGDGGASYWDVVQYDTTPAAGARGGCDTRLAQGFDLIAAKSATADGRAELMASFSLCVPPAGSADPPPLTADDADGFRMQLWLLYALDDYAMGNYPFPSTYLIGADAVDPLPAFPMRAACDLIMDSGSRSGSSGGGGGGSSSGRRGERSEKARRKAGGGEETDEINKGGEDDDGDDAALLAGLAAAANLLYNATGDVACYPSLPSRDDELDGIWDYQFCTEMMCQETYFSRRGPADGGIFPPYAFNASWVDGHCADKFGPQVTPRRDWIARSYGGWAALTGGNDDGNDDGFVDGRGASSNHGKGGAAGAATATATATASNIVFSNGEYDPWRAAGVTGLNVTDRDIVSLLVLEGAHHLDLMFATDDDGDSVAHVRALELKYIAKWAAEVAAEAEEAAKKKKKTTAEL